MATDIFRALVVGEALLDVVSRPDGSRQEHPGGSPANVALGLGRLGRLVDLLTWLGDDGPGRRILDHLRGADVEVLAGSDSAPATSIALAELDPEGSATYRFDLTWDVPVSWVEPSSAPLVVHTGSIAAAVVPGGEKVLDLLAARRTASTITYDPNLRPALMGGRAEVAATVGRFLDLADVVKVSDEDLSWLHPEQPPIDVARDWARRGPALVVLTRGGSGATAVTARGEEVTVIAPTVAVSDTVGAGDSFMAGLIDALWTADLLGAAARGRLAEIGKESLIAVVEHCARIAAITVSRAGAEPPTRAELAAWSETR